VLVLREALRALSDGAILVLVAAQVAKAGDLLPKPLPILIEVSGNLCQLTLCAATQVVL
jgi:hypothetical protein